MKTIKKLFSGLCPETGKNQTIQITFGEAGMCGNLTPEYKPTAFICEYLSEHGCDSCDPHGRCPFVKKATQEINHR